MALNSSGVDIIKRRREVVARLRIMGMTSREIADALAKPGPNQVLNPLTNEPFSHVTIHNDIVALTDEWRENAALSTQTHVARQLAEIQEIKRQAFLNRDGLLALRAIDREIKILGTAAPDKVEIKVNIEVVTRAWQALEKAGKDPEVVFGRLAEQAERRVQ
jgi:hypothetical protein